MIDLNPGTIYKYIIFILSILASASIGRAQAPAPAPASAPLTRAADSGTQCDDLLNRFIQRDAQRPRRFLRGRLVTAEGKRVLYTNQSQLEQSVELRSRLSDNAIVDVPVVQERIVFSRASLTPPSDLFIRIERTSPASTSQGVRGLFLKATQTSTGCSLDSEGTIQKNPRFPSMTIVELSFDRPFCELLNSKLPRISAALSAAPGARCELETGSIETTPKDCAYELVKEAYEGYNRRLSSSSGTGRPERYQLSRYMDYAPSVTPRMTTTERNEFAVMRAAIHSCQTPGAPEWSPSFLTYLERGAGPNANFSFRLREQGVPAGSLPLGATDQQQ